MNIRFFLLASLACAMSATPSLARDEKPVLRKKPAVVNIGDRWKISRKKYKSADVTVYWDIELGDAGMRTPSVDESRSTFRNSPFPLSTAKETYFDVNALVTISVEGKVTECRFDPETLVDAEMGIDPLAIDHICPMLRQHVVFHPALDQNGERVERKGRMFGSYSLLITDTSKPPLMISPPASTMMRPGKASAAFPLIGAKEDFSFKTIGLSEQKMKELDKNIIIARLKIDKEGRASNCRLTAATNVDELDRQICANAIATPFVAARNDNGDNIESDYLLMVFSPDIIGE